MVACGCKRHLLLAANNPCCSARLPANQLTVPSSLLVFASSLAAGVEVVPARGANVLSLLRRDYLVVTKPGLDALIERLQRPINRLGAAGLAFRLKLQQRRAAEARQKRIQQIWTAPKLQKQATA